MNFNKFEIFLKFLKVLEIYHQESDEVYFLEVDIQYLENLPKTQNVLLFLTESMNIEKAKKRISN